MARQKEITMNDAEEKLKRKITELLAISNVIRELNLSLDLSIEQIIATFANASSRLFLMDKSAFVLLNENISIHTFGGESNFKEEIEKIEFTKIYPQIKEKMRPLLVEEIEEEGSRNRLNALGIGLIVPLFLRKELKGIYLVGARNNQVHYCEEDKNFIFNFTNQLMVTVENADYFKLLQSHVEELTIFNEITAAINSGLDAEMLLDMVLRALSEILGAVAGFIIIFKKTTKETLFFIPQGLDENKKNMLLKSKDTEGIIPKSISSCLDEIISFYPDTSLPQEKELFMLDNQNMNYWLCRVLSIAKEDTVGIVGLAKRLHETINRENLNLFLTLTNQLIMIVLNARLYELSITDGLTGLFVHRYFAQRLKEEVTRGLRYASKFSIIMMDVDRFKECNDLLGHQKGNIILKKIAEVIKLSIRKYEDIPARWGGDELAIILPETGREGAYVLAERIRRNIENFNFSELTDKIKVTISAGISSFPADAIEENELLKKADAFLYEAKKAGGNAIRYHL